MRQILIRFRAGFLDRSSPLLDFRLDIGREFARVPPTGVKRASRGAPYVGLIEDAHHFRVQLVEYGAGRAGAAIPIWSRRAFLFWDPFEGLIIGVRGGVRERMSDAS